MGVGYSASPLHCISYFDTSARTRPAVPGENPLWDAFARGTGTYPKIYEGPPRYLSPSKADILTWRDRIASKYHDQLGEDLTWGEDSGFEQSQDNGTTSDMLLRYVAAVFDQRGPGAASILVGLTKPSYPELDRAFAEAERRGFGGQFPQLLLGARYWLPFERGLMIEEPNWLGDVERYGSAPRLMDELMAVRAFISSADPGATVATAKGQTILDNTLAAAWQASDTVARLCAAAVAQHLPLWTTG